MIRINLLGQARPKATKQALPLEATVQFVFLLGALGLALAVLGLTYMQDKRQLDQVNNRITALNAEKASLEQIKTQVEQFEQQKAMLKQRIDVIETLQKNRTGGQELLQMVANTVVRVDSLWLTSLERKQDALDIQGEAASISAVANFITQLKRSGYFDKVEITEAKEDDLEKGTQTFGFKMTASVAPGGPTATAQPAAAVYRPSAAKGRS
ncbi:MAG TPA: PilN domain-containing protein [Candidatus Acidoferrales bacterium]|nr:PilN domain-containing protein [Candidatus Acidoferrales bacterium]